MKTGVIVVIVYVIDKEGLDDTLLKLTGSELRLCG
jgi:hypothetical protein